MLCAWIEEGFNLRAGFILRLGALKIMTNYPYWMVSWQFPARLMAPRVIGSIAYWVVWLDSPIIIFFIKKRPFILKGNE